MKTMIGEGAFNEMRPAVEEQEVVKVQYKPPCQLPAFSAAHPVGSGSQLVCLLARGRKQSAVSFHVLNLLKGNAKGI